VQRKMTIAKLLLANECLHVKLTNHVLKQENHTYAKCVVVYETYTRIHLH
jgi:hypothetical protein